MARAGVERFAELVSRIDRCERQCDSVSPFGASIENNAAAVILSSSGWLASAGGLFHQFRQCHTD
jgi:hypothetical protein